MCFLGFELDVYGFIIEYDGDVILYKVEVLKV